MILHFINTKSYKLLFCQYKLLYFHHSHYHVPIVCTISYHVPIVCPYSYHVPITLHTHIQWVTMYPNVSKTQKNQKNQKYQKKCQKVLTTA